MAAKTIKIGTRVEVRRKRVVGTGIVAYMGTIKFSDGQWIGVVLDEAKGKNNGTVEGKTYFTCPDNHGVFVRHSMIRAIDDAGVPTTTTSFAPSPPVEPSPPETPKISGLPPPIYSGVTAPTPSSGLPTPSKDLAVVSDCVDNPEQDSDIAVVSEDADLAVVSESGDNPEQDADLAVVSDCVENPEQDADIDVGSDFVDNPKPDADAVIGINNLELLVKEYLRDFEEAVWKRGVADLSDFITDDLNKWRECKINIAVIGESGTGKSSFINAIRGLRPGDEFNAQTGSSETTTTIKHYPHPEHHNLVFWDLPGVGTQQFPKESYLSVVDVKKYDFFILVSATRFKENDAWLAKEICNIEKKFYLVKCKIDIDVNNDLEDSGGTLKKKDAIDNLRQSTKKELMKTGLTLPKLFLVNNRNIHEYDFKDLITQLIHDIPALKMDTLILSMSSLAKIILDEKRKLLKKRELPTAIKAAIVMGLHGDRVYKVVIGGSIFDVDIGALLQEAKFYRQQFGTFDESLKIIADRLNISFDDLVQNLNIVSTSIVQSEDSFMPFFSMCEKRYTSTMGLLAVPFAAIPLCMFVQREILKMCYCEALRILTALQAFLAAT